MVGQGEGGARGPGGEADTVMGALGIWAELGLD